MDRVLRFFSKERRRGTFEVKRAKGGGHYFVLKAANGEVVCVSEVYSSKQAALKGVNAVRSLAGKARTIIKCDPA